jgi:predicted 3-demethylubiquinone-9 3-methyltransferase (glyoxalase superfamily)
MSQQKIVPSIWCNGNAAEVANFYVSVFPDSALGPVAHYPTEGLLDFQRDMAGKELVVEFNVGGLRMIAINAGPEFTPNPMLSFMLNFDPARDERAAERLDDVWAQLSEGGRVLMELAEYPFSPHYGWVQDRYGVSWQLMLTNPDGEPRPFVIPALMFANANTNRAEEAARFYVSLFEDARIGTLARWPQAQGEVEAGSVMFGEFAVGDEWFAVMDSPVRHDFDFNEAISLQIDCADQAEIDHFWKALSTVPEAEQCGWCKDRFGVSWQVVPGDMGEVMDQPENYAAMMRMKKIVLADFVTR